MANLTGDQSFHWGASYLKNFAINNATGGIGNKAKWGGKLGAYALRQGIEIAGDTAIDVGVYGRNLGQSLAWNTAASIGGEAAFKLVGKGLNSAWTIASSPRFRQGAKDLWEDELCAITVPGPKSASILKHRATSGAVLESSPGRTTTILGSYNMDLRYVIAELGNVKSLDFGPKPGGFNVLNVPDELYVNPKQFWREYNKPWLDAVISRGDEIIIATTPKMPVLRKFNTETGKFQLTGFGREYLYLRKNGAPSAFEY